MQHDFTNDVMDFTNDVIHILTITKFNIENIDCITFNVIKCDITKLPFHTKRQVFYYYWHIIQTLKLTDFFMSDCIKYFGSQISGNSVFRFDIAISEHINKLILQRLNTL